MTAKSYVYRSHGFTLIEMMIVISLVGIFIAIAVPAMAGYVNNAKVSGISNEFVFGLRAARTEAMASGVTVSFCAASTANGDVCDTGATPTWANGWIIMKGVQVIKRSNELKGVVISVAPVATPTINFTAGMGSAAAVTFTVCKSTLGRSIAVATNGKAVINRITTCS